MLFVFAVPGLSSFAFVEYEKENGAKNALDREVSCLISKI